MFILLARYLFLYWTNSLALRAFRATIDEMGTAPIPVIITVGWWLIYLLYGAVRALGEGGLSAMKTFILKQMRWSLGAAFVVWSPIFLYKLSHPKYTVEEVGEYGRTLLVSTKSASDSTPVVWRSGFWGTTKGYMVTCLPTLPEPKIEVGMLLPPLLSGRLITVPMGLLVSEGNVLDFDEETCIAVVRVPANPFDRTMHMIAASEDVNTLYIESTTEKYSAAHFSADASKLGDRVLLAAIVQENSVDPAYAAVEGRITRLASDISKENRSLRLHTDIRSRNTFLGAPLLNDSNQVVGVVVAEDEGYAVAAPSKYVTEILRRALK